MAGTTKKATAPAAVEEDSDDDIESLDEVETEAEASEPAKKAKKAPKAKPERKGLSTKEAADQLGITPVRLRRILRSEDGGHADKEYTRYDLTQEEVDKIKELLASGQAAKSEKKAKKSKKSADVEAAAAEVEEELGDLEDVATEDEDDDLDLDSDDEDDDEE